MFKPAHKCRTSTLFAAVICSTLVTMSSAAAQESPWADVTDSEAQSQWQPKVSPQPPATPQALAAMEPTGMMADNSSSVYANLPSTEMGLLAPQSVDMRAIPSGSFSLGFPVDGKGVTNKPWANVDWDETLANRPQYSLPTQPMQPVPSPTPGWYVPAGAQPVAPSATNSAYAPGKTGTGEPGPGSTYTAFVKNWDKKNGPPPIPIFTCKNGYGWIQQAGANAPVVPGGGINGGPGTIQWTGSYNSSSLYE